MKKIFTAIKAFAPLTLLVFLIYVFFLYKMPARVYETKEAGINIKDSVNNGEWYTFTNTSSKQKVLLGLHFEPMVVREPEPLFKVVIEPNTTSFVKVPSDFTDQIRICELDCKTANILPIAYVNAARLRNGHKD